MAILLLVLLALTTGTGMIKYAQEDGRGPLAPMLAAPTATGARRESFEEEGEEVEYGAYGERESFVHGEEGEEGEEEAESAFAELHEVFANLTLALIVLRIIGVLYSSWAHHENLVRAMLTGRKRPKSAGGE